jgi:hypothetical protein
MGKDPIQRNIQFPLELFDELSKIAKANGISFAAVVREACIQYLDTNTPDRCPKCRTQNEPDARFCKECSNPLTDEARMSVTQAEQFIKKSAVYQEVLDTIREELGLEKKDKQSE